MAIEVGALRALLSLDSAAFEKGSKRAQASMSDLQRKLNAASQRMRTIGRTLSRNISLPLAGIAAVAVRSSLRTIDAQAKMAQSFGTSTRSMQVLERAADRAGISQGELNQVTLQLTKRLSQAAQGGGPAIKTLDKLGLSAEALSKLDLDQKILAINTAIAENVPATERAAVAATLFGDRAGILAGRLDPEAIAAANAEIERFGVAVSEVDADKIEEANDALSGLGLVSRGLANQLAVALAPTLKRIAEFVADVATWFSNLSPKMKTAIGVATLLAGALGPVAVGLGLVLAGLTPLVGAFGALLSPIGLIGAALVGLGAGVYYVVRRWDTLVEKFPVLQTVLDGVLVGLQIFKDAFAAQWKYISAQLSLTVEVIKSLLQGDFAGALGSIGQIATNAKNLLITAFEGIWEGIKPALIALSANLVTWASALPEKIAEGLKGLGDAAKSAIAEMAKELESAIKDLAADALIWAKAVGADIVAGLREGISRNFKGFKSWVGGLFGEVEEVARDTVETRSPSKVFSRIGVDIVDGLQVGMEGRQSRLLGSVRGIAGSITDVFQDLRSDIGNAIGDAFAGLGEGVSGLLSALKTTFQRGLSDLVSTGVQGAFGGGSSGGLGSSISGLVKTAVGSFGEGGSILGLGGLGGGGGLLGGLGNAVSGGLGNIFSIGANAAAAGGGLAASLGAAIPVIGIAAAAFSFFRKKVTELDAGIRVTTSGLQTFVDTFSKTKTTRFWGLSKKIETDFDEASSDVADPILQSIAGIGESIMGLADVLDLESARIAATEFEFSISTKGKSQEEVQQEIQQRLGDLANTMTDTIVGSYKEILPDEAEIARLETEIARKLSGGHGRRGGEDALAAEIARLREQQIAAETAIEITHLNEEFAQFQQEGEASFDTLQRLSSSLLAANESFRDLGFELYDVSLAGAGAASEFVGLFGSLEGFGVATSAYYQDFYSAAEQAQNSTARLGEALTELGVDVMPATNAQFRAMVDAAIAGGDPQLAASLIQIAPAFAGIGNAAANLNDAMGPVVDRFYTTAEQIDHYTEQATTAFREAGLELPATAEAFRAAAQRAATDVRSIMSMVSQGQASLSDLQAAQQRQADLISLAEDAARVYDLQAAAEESKAAIAEEAARLATEAEEDRAREAQLIADQLAADQAQAAADLAAAQQAAAEEAQRIADAAADSLSEIFSAIGDGIKSLLGLADDTANISDAAAENVLRTAINTGQADEDSLRSAVSQLSDLSAENFVNFNEFQREQLRRASLLDLARTQLGYIAPTPSLVSGTSSQQILSGAPSSDSISALNARLASHELLLQSIATSNREIETDVREFTEFTVT